MHLFVPRSGRQKGREALKMEIAKGTKVAWVAPRDAAEQAEIMTVVEVRGERLLVTSSLHDSENWRIRPTTVVAAKDVKVAD